ncbi:ABC transporter permease [Staphylococcus chromogenes]|nr:ABC transporter permease [Staphylococcus chromogenes]
MKSTVDLRPMFRDLFLSTIKAMFQAFKELRAARGRTLLIVGTVAMIAVLVSFLSALTSGLSHQSKSELDRLAELTSGQLSSTSLVIADSGTPSLSASNLSSDQVASLGGTPLYTARARVGEHTAIVVSNPAVPRGEAAVSPALYSESSSVRLGDRELRVTAGLTDVWLDHQPIVEANPADVAPLTLGVSAVLLNADATPAPDVPGTRVLSGKDIYQVSASYVGENMSLTTMTYLLFVISALIVGAFFAVWTMQRLRGVAISTALGASRAVIIADALAQALFVLVLGAIVGISITAIGGSFLDHVMPIVVSPATTLAPGLTIIGFGLLGAVASLRPIFTVDPRTALSAT